MRLEITVDAKGNVAAMRVLSGHSALRPAAQKAVRSWRFKPATRGGVPIEYTFETTVTFSQSRRP